MNENNQWLKELGNDDELWPSCNRSYMPSVINFEYDILRSMAINGNLYGLLLQIKDVYELIRRGDLDKMSFAFTVEKQQVEYDDKEKICTRTILKFDKIFDVAVVDFPAYDGTEISTVEGRSAEYFQELEAKAKEAEERKKLLLRTYL